MSKEQKRLFNIVMVLLSWISLSPMDWRSIKRFFPAFIFVFLINCFDVPIGKKRKWWFFYHKPNSFIQNEFPFLIGPMLAVALWTLKRGFGNFGKFITLNALYQIFFSFLAKTFFPKVKLFKLVRFNGFQFFIYFFYKAFLLYGFQYIFESKEINKIHKKIKEFTLNNEEEVL